MRVTDNDRAKHIEMLLNAFCKEQKIEMFSSDGRRKSDLIAFTLYGDRQAILKMPLKLAELLKAEDIEILQSGRRGIDYVLVFVVTEKLRLQVQEKKERRAKIIYRRERRADLKHEPIHDRNGNIMPENVDVTMGVSL